MNVHAYAIMTNHYHLVVAIDCGRALKWSDNEVFDRWGQVFPRSAERARQMPPEVQRDLAAKWRHRLCSLSWFMRCLNEAIARRANREDGCTGRFWEGRYHSQALLDDAALVTCMCYVDLNEVKAGLSRSLSSSSFSSIGERLKQKRRSSTSVEQWLVGFGDSASAHQPPMVSEHDGESARPIPIDFQSYVELLETCAEALQGRSEEQGTRWAAVAALERLGLHPERFADAVQNFGRTFPTWAGHVDRLLANCQRLGQRRCHGSRAAQALYRKAA
ncbi:MAG: transposase [Candidatus Binatia bacterium]|nr:MAG: transposase [Candidatus Binatia bacterium]